MDFNRYFTNSELNEILENWKENYGEILQIDSIGHSYQGRPINLLTLTNKRTGPSEEKPAIWLDGNIHATEIAATTTLLCFVEKVLTSYGNDEKITRLLDTSVFYIVPRVNPDGVELAMAKSPKYIRSGVRPYPWDENAEGLHQQDIDGDGRILQMRVSDPNGDWKISSLNPRLMEKRGPDEDGGKYFRIFPEGLIEDWDGYIIKVARPK